MKFGQILASVEDFSLANSRESMAPTDAGVEAEASIAAGLAVSQVSVQTRVLQRMERRVSRYWVVSNLVWPLLTKMACIFLGPSLVSWAISG